MTERMVGGGDPFYLQFWVKLTPLERKSRLSIDIRTWRLSRSEKVQLTPTWSPLRAFQWVYDGHRTLPLSPQRGLKNTKRPFFISKIAHCLKKVCYKVYLCESCQRQSCRAFIGLTIRVKMIDEGHPLPRENLANTDPPLAKRLFSIYFRS